MNHWPAPHRQPPLAPTTTLLLALVALAPAPPAAATTTAAAAANDVATLLKTADRYRTSSDDLQVDTLVTTLAADGSVDKERRYTVFTQSQHRSLVLMKSPAEAGQKVLMLGDDFWLLMPGSQRPLRITPSQKLLGDAATGDIATLSWSQDYSGQIVAETACDPGAATSITSASTGPAPGAGRHSARCLHLSLQAQRKGVSYQRIELWLGLPRHEPVRADLYVQSDKLAKLARFVVDSPSAPTLVTEMWLQDRLGNQRQTRVQYLARQPRQVPENWLNPMFLARTPTLE